MTSEPALPAESGAAPDTVALARIVAHQRAELERLRDESATAAVVERARGAVMALTGCSPDAARDMLAQRAGAAGRTLLEECWITLGELTPPTDPAPPPDARRRARLVPTSREASESGSVDLGRLGRALVRVGTPQDLARCLLNHLSPGPDADAVMIFARLPSGGLELIGHAGIDDRLAAQWRQVPPLGGIAALDALRSGEPRWLEDVRREREQHLLIGDPPDRWLSRAWLPMTARDSADICVGFLRARGGPFTPRTRAHLLAVARLCAGRLRAFGSPRDPADADSVQAVLDALPGATLLLAPERGPSGEAEDYRVTAATREAFDAFGRTGHELVGLRLLECFPTLAGRPLWQACHRTLATGEPYDSEPFAQETVAGGVAELSTHTVRVARLGGSLTVSWLRHASSDVQEQRLADMQRLGSLGWVTWNLVTQEATWSSQVYAALDRDPADGPVRLTALPALALREDVPALTRAVTELVRHGRPSAVPFRTGEGDAVRHLRLVAEAVTDLGGTPVEVHGFVQDVTAQRSAELALVESEQAILTQYDDLRAERSLAARLQHALLPLPTRLLRPAGLRVEVAYLPAQSGIHVGGDWFSAIELPDGDALFVVGDVAGHGMDAVATMAQLRFTAKGMLITGSSLTGALARLNALLLHSRGRHGTATMVLARYSPADRRLVWAQAGHPPPLLLLRDGRARYLDRPGGMLLGACASPRFTEQVCPLEPGDRILLYTDGLVERPSEGLDRGLQRLADAAVAHPAAGRGALRPLLADLLEGELRDDVCVVDIRVPGGRT
ncbi:SpoIIE family protein phosphatase [Streptomyces sp. NPDC090106]|uniref:SpoIIE family protein phosphatase n=1 Tax=Streptomyces sp. NPDC090106 TaxID=3365946 RepID=UPI0037F15A8D